MNAPLSIFLANLSFLLINRIPPLAWVAIAVIVLLFLVTNIILIAMLLARNLSTKSLRQAQARGSMNPSRDLAKLGEVMRDPLAKERSQLNELSQLVQGLDKKDADSQDELDSRNIKS